MQATDSVTTTGRAYFFSVFVLLYVMTTYIPVFPIYHSSAIYKPSFTIQAVLPVSDVYYGAYHLIDPAFLSWPILISHVLVSYWLALWLTRGTKRPQFSLLWLLGLTGGVASLLACLLVFGAIGFGILFIAMLSVLILANIFGYTNMLGIRLICLGKSGLVLATILWVILALSGVALPSGLYPIAEWNYAG